MVERSHGWIVRLLAAACTFLCWRLAPRAGTLGPVRRLVVALPAARRDVAGALLFELGAAGVEETNDGLAVYGEHEEIARFQRAIAQCLPMALCRVEDVADTWQSAWIAYLKPEPITDRIVLQPIDDATPAPADKRKIVFEPRMAFGVGSHPTTRLAARAVERTCLAHPGVRVLDVGTGTGVLAIVAAVSGAGSVLGIDVDPVAVEAARTNAHLNAVDDACRFSTTPLADVGDRFQLVVANIDAPTLIALAPQLGVALAPGGTLLVTGLLATRIADVAGALAGLGLAPDRQALEEDWALLELSRRRP